MIRIDQFGNFNNLERFLKKNHTGKYLRIFNKYGQKGVDELSKNTPRQTGKTAESWEYEIKRLRNGFTLTWYNTNVVDGVPIAIILQYGHATRGGSFVQGTDYINPTLKPIFDKLSEDLWKEVTTI